MTTIYHNPRCSKSRECFNILNNAEKGVEVINYIRNPFRREKFLEIIELLQIAPIELVRTNESIWKENYKGRKLSDEEIIEAMLEHPKLIQRPIVVKDGKAVIARPPEDVFKLLQ